MNDLIKRLEEDLADDYKSLDVDLQSLVDVLNNITRSNQNVIESLERLNKELKNQINEIPQTRK